MSDARRLALWLGAIVALGCLVVVAASVGIPGDSTPAAPRSTSTTIRATTTTTSTAAEPSYLFRDEFNGTHLDASKWGSNWLGPSGDVTKPVHSQELSCYDPANVSVRDGYLRLKAEERRCVEQSPRAGRVWQYASGIVTTAGRFTFTDGRIEARVWLPGSSKIANWPAFWTNGTGTYPTTGENDIVEGLDGQACWHTHSPSGDPGGCATGNFSGWHTFAAEIRDGTSTYFYDGVKVGTLATVSAPHFIILNLGISTVVSPPAIVPSEMLVDYVRVTP